MSTLLSGLMSRVVAIVAQGRGSNGALGAEAQVRSIPAGAFRTTPNGAPMTETRITTEAWDRAFSMWALSIGVGSYDNRTRQSSQFREVRLAVDVGYVYGENSAFVHVWPGSTESAATVVYQVTQRAIGNAERISRALCFIDLYQDISDDPIIVAISRDGDSVVTDLGAGRLLCRTIYRVTLELNVNNNYDPPASP